MKVKSVYAWTVELKECPQCGLDENKLLKPSIEGKANEK